MSADVDMAVALARQPRGEVGVTPLLVRACALALRDVPGANGAYRDGRFERYSRVNVGVAVPGADGYAMPTLPDADRKSLQQLAEEIEVAQRRALDAQLSPRDSSGATFTLYDLGALGVDRGSPLIVPPQAAAAAAGAVRKVAAVRDGALASAMAMTLTVACDHRILYGGEAAAFLSAIKRRLEEASP